MRLARIAIVLLLAAPCVARASADATLRESIVAILRAEATLAGARVDVDVQEATVLLRGTARLYAHRLRAEQIAWTQPGVREVENEIRVVPWLGASDAELERAIREVAKRNEQFHGSDLSVAVAGGRVRLAGVFREPGDVIFLRHVVAEIEGVREIEIEARLRS